MTLSTALFAIIWLAAVALACWHCFFTNEDQ